MKPDLIPGERIHDRYTVTRSLGKGGSGTTYEVTTDDGKTLALKRLVVSQVDNWKAVELFEREAGVLGHLEHPAIPKYVDSFRVEDGGDVALFLAQELAPGKPVSEWLAQGWRVQEPEAIRIADQVLRVLSYLHGLRPPVVHRDIKPHNLIRRDDGAIFLVDFGAVRAEYRGTFEGSTVAGTYGYMAPEQFRAQAVPATDLYGLGATLIEILTGRPPSELPSRNGMIDYRAAVKLSAPFCIWLDRMIALDPQSRFEHAGAALTALRERRAPKLVRPWIGLVGMFALLAAVGAAGISFKINRAPSLPVAHAADQHRTFSPDFPHRFDLAGHWSGVFSVAFLDGGSRLASGSYDATVKLWDMNDGKMLRPLPPPGGKVASVLALPQSGQLAVAGNKNILLYATAEGSATRTLEGHKAQINEMSVTLDGKTLASVGDDKTVRVWDLDSGKTSKVIETPSPLLAVAIDPAGKWVAAAGRDPVINVWSLPDGALLKQLIGHNGPVNKLSISPDGQTLVSVCDDRTARVWALAFGNAVFTLSDHTDEVWSVAISPDGHALATGTKDDVVRLWDLYAGKKLADFSAGVGGVIALAYDEGGRNLVAAGAKGLVRVYGKPQPTWRPPRVTAPVAAKPPPALPADATDVDKLVWQAQEEIDKPDQSGIRAAALLLRKAVAANPRHAMARVLLGRTEYLLGYHQRDEYDPEALQRALVQVDAALEIEPNLAQAMVVKGWALAFQKKVDEAKLLGDKALAADPHEWRAHVLLAHLANRTKHGDEALHHARTVVEGSSEPVALKAAYAELLGFYRSRRDWDALDEVYQSLLNLSPGSAWNRGNYAQFLSSMGKHDNAIAMARTALSMHDYPAGRAALADALANKAISMLDNPATLEAARPLIDESLKTSPHSSDAHLALGFYERAKSNNRAAAKEFELALAIEPDNTRAKQALGR